MAELIFFKTHKDIRGSLTVIEKQLPFDIKRLFYIYDVQDSIRGKHRHHKTIQAAICISGSCVISNNDGKISEDYNLDTPDKCLLIFPEDYHTMYNFSKGAILLVLASENYDPNDYIYETY
jgi:hypothetical protein